MRKVSLKVGQGKGNYTCIHSEHPIKM